MAVFEADQRVVVDRAEIAADKFVALDAGADATEEHVAAVRTLVRGLQVEQAGAAADDVVLSKAAEDDVAAATALNVIVAVVGVFERGVDPEVAFLVAPSVDLDVIVDVAVDRAVALDDVVAQLAEDHVAAGTAGDVVVAEVVQPGLLVGMRVVEQRDLQVAP